MIGSRWMRQKSLVFSISNYISTFARLVPALGVIYFHSICRNYPSNCWRVIKLLSLVCVQSNSASRWVCICSVSCELLLDALRRCLFSTIYSLKFVIEPPKKISCYNISTSWVKKMLACWVLLSCIWSCVPIESCSENLQISECKSLLDEHKVSWCSWLDETTTRPFIPNSWSGLYEPKENHTKLITLVK